MKTDPFKMKGFFIAQRKLATYPQSLKCAPIARLVVNDLLFFFSGICLAKLSMATKKPRQQTMLPILYLLTGLAGFWVFFKSISFFEKI